MHRVEEWLAMDALKFLKNFPSVPDSSVTDPCSPYRRWQAARKVNELRQRHETGDPLALMEAVKRCAESQLIMPLWVATAVSAAYLAIWAKSAGSWDEVLGAPLKKRQRRAVAEKNHYLAVMVHMYVTDILRAEPNTARDEALFERVGEELGIGKTLASELWYKNPVWLPR